MIHSLSETTPMLHFETSLTGKEETPILICNDFFPEINKFLEFTYRHVTFEKESSTYYPGLRAPLPKDYTFAVINKIYAEIVETYKLPPHKKPIIRSAFYSFVSKPEQELSVLQRIPHCDNMKPSSFAIMHYLNPGEFGGTGLFRHRPTGFERIDMNRKDDYFESLKNYFEEHGNPQTRYINASDDHFELISNINYHANRLIIYPSNILHSGLISPARDIHQTPKTARLTANIFVDF